MAAAPNVHVDALSVLTAGLSAVVVLGTFKVLALKYHGHPMAQAFLVLF
jgi:hypothetical protein